MQKMRPQRQQTPLRLRVICDTKVELQSQSCKLGHRPDNSKVDQNFEHGNHQRQISDIRIKTGGGLVARSLLGMGWSLTRTPAKLEACD